METTNETLDQQRWLMANGLFTQSAKDSLFVYGSLVHRDVKAVEVHIDSEAKIVAYDVYCPPKLLKLRAKFFAYRGSTSLIRLWLLRRMLKKNGNLDFETMLDRFVKDFCGPRWKATLKTWDQADYVDGPDDGEIADREPHLG